jgi:hypothetical protein
MEIKPLLKKFGVSINHPLFHSTRASSIQSILKEGLNTDYRHWDSKTDVKEHKSVCFTRNLCFIEGEGEHLEYLGEGDAILILDRDDLQKHFKLTPFSHPKFRDQYTEYEERAKTPHLDRTSIPPKYFKAVIINDKALRTLPKLKQHSVPIILRSKKKYIALEDYGSYADSHTRVLDNIIHKREVTKKDEQTLNYIITKYPPSTRRVSTLLSLTNTPISTLNILYSQMDINNPTIAYSLASGENTPSKYLEYIAKGNDTSAFLELKHNTSTPANVLGIMEKRMQNEDFDIDHEYVIENIQKHPNYTARHIPVAAAIRKYCGHCGTKVANNELPLAAAGGFSTGKYKKFTFLKNTMSAGNFGKTFGQHIEPSGYYFNAVPEGHRPPTKEWVTGIAEVHNPLVILWGAKGFESGYSTPGNWKNVLSTRYKAKGKALTNKLLKDGYDAIITVVGGDTSESVLLKPKSQILEVHDG